MRFVTRPLPVLAVLALCAVSAAQTVLYVDPDASAGTQNGDSWVNAFSDLRTGLSVAAQDGGPVELRVAAGVYLPDFGEGVIPGDRNATFSLVNNVTVRGGHAGFGALDPDKRDFSAHTSILSGNIGSSGSSADNSYHVVTANGVDATAVLDGFTVRGGNANAAAPNNDGAGLRIVSGAGPTITHCVVDGNAALDQGGGMHISGGAMPEVINSTFLNNTGTSQGGAIYIEAASSASLTNCTVTRNTSGAGAGLFVAATATATAINTIIFGNTSTGVGGTGTATITFSDVQGGHAGTGNINADPLFVNAAAGNVRLSAGSPCINTGSNAAADLPALDLDLLIRVSDGTVDMGAYEFADCDGDGTPDSQEADGDGDGVPTDCDNCPTLANPDQLDGDTDNIGDCCDPSLPDSDGDGVRNVCEMPAGVRAVRAGAPAGGNGTDWRNAYNNLQTAINAAVATGGMITQLRVAAGEYRPNSAGLMDPRDATFQLRNGLTIRGGYSGFLSPAGDVQNVVVYESILTGDLNDDDDDEGPGGGGPGENSYHVVTGGGTNAAAVLDGVVVEAGNADGAVEHRGSGGGMYSEEGDPTVVNCTFRNNFAMFNGGGMYNEDIGVDGPGLLGSNPTVRNCRFLSNSALFSGGGMFNSNSSKPLIADCVFHDNSANTGAGIANQILAAPTIVRTSFHDNHAEADGGAIADSDAASLVVSSTFDANGAVHGAAVAASNSNGRTTYLVNSVLSANSSILSGAAVYGAQSSLRVINCTIRGNVSSSGGSALSLSESSATVVNSIIWGNSFPPFSGNSSAVIAYSDVQGGFAGSGNMNVDPQFDDAEVAASLGLNSPCIDAGANGAAPFDSADLDGDGVTLEKIPFDLAGNPRFVDVLPAPDIGQGTAPVIDMGALEHVTGGDVFNLTRGTYHATIPQAVEFAQDGDVIEGSVTSFANTFVIAFTGKALDLRSTGEITQPITGAWSPADGSAFHAADFEAITFNGRLGMNPLATLELSAIEVNVSNTGAVSVPGGSLLMGTFNNGGTFEFYGAEVYTFGTFFTNLSGGEVTGYGDIFASFVVNDGMATFIADTQVVGNYTNNQTTVVQSGTLTVTGTLTNNGTIVGDTSRGSGGGLSVLGDYTAGAAATLRMGGGRTMSAGGDYDVAINDNDRYDMADATLQMVGLGGVQELEVMSRDIGPLPAGLDRTQNGHYPIDTLRIGPTATTVNVVDHHDNDGLGQGSCEAVYVRELIVEPGATLNLLGTCKLYYETLTNNGGAIGNPGNLAQIFSTGACCTGTTCATKTPFECQQGGGVFLGLGDSCSAGLCAAPPVGGACCLTGGECARTANTSVCNELAGAFAGTGQSCTTPGVCPECVGAVDCSDGSVCTSDSCSGGACDHDAIDCDDNNACTSDMCDGAFGCGHSAVDCDDGNACTADGCTATGGCASTPISCDDGSACTTDSCNSVSGCANDTIDCEDGDPCTTDSCDAGSGCVHMATACGGACCYLGSCSFVADGSQCSAFVCNVADHLPPTFNDCYGDADGNGFVNPADRGFVAANIGQTDPALLCRFDMDGNGFITPSDRGFIAANIGLCTALPDFQNGSGQNHGVPDARFGMAAFAGAGTSCATTSCP